MIFVADGIYKDVYLSNRFTVSVIKFIDAISFEHLQWFVFAF